MKNLILILRLGVGFPTAAESKALKECVDAKEHEIGTDDEPIAVGTPLSGPNIPIPGLNKDGNMLSIIQTRMSAEQVAKVLADADDFLPALCIDITDQIENIQDGKIAITDQLAKTSGVGELLVDVFDLEPQGFYDKEEHKEREKKKEKALEKLKAKIKEKDHSDEKCDCPACKIRRELFKDGSIEGVEDVGEGIAVQGLEALERVIEKLKGIEGLGEKLKDFADRKSKKKKDDLSELKYKRKGCNLDLDQLLDLVKEKGFEGLSDPEKERLHYLSKNHS